MPGLGRGGMLAGFGPRADRDDQPDGRHRPAGAAACRRASGPDGRRRRRAAGAPPPPGPAGGTRTGARSRRRGHAERVVAGPRTRTRGRPASPGTAPDAAGGATGGCAARSAAAAWAAAWAASCAAFSSAALASAAATSTFVRARHRADTGAEPAGSRSRLRRAGGRRAASGDRASRGRLRRGRRGRAGAAAALPPDRRERFTEPPRDGCLHRRGRRLHELAKLLELGEHGLTLDTELFRELVYAGLACHWTPHPRPGGDPLDLLLTTEACSLLGLHRLLIPIDLLLFRVRTRRPHNRCCAEPCHVLADRRRCRRHRSRAAHARRRGAFREREAGRIGVQ